MTTQPQGRIAAYVLTGFLGAGKTTLLNRFLSAPELVDTAVIINEFGSIGLDHLLVESVEDGIVLLKSGCICCSIRGDLKESVLSLFERRQNGTIRAFSRLVIETTGLADPAPIIATLSADLMLKYHFTIGSVITVVDVPNGRRNIQTYLESARQVAVADRIVITKGDLGTDEDYHGLIETLRAINPAAGITRCNEMDAPESAMLLESIHDLSARSDMAVRAVAAERHHAHDHADETDINRHGQIRAIAISADKPVQWARFALWLSMLINRHGRSILRLKGILLVEGSEMPVFIHGVQHLIHKPFQLTAWPEGVKKTSIVIIAENLDGDLQRSFDAFNIGSYPT